MILKSRLKRDGPIFLFSGAVKFAGDESMIVIIVAPRWGKTSRPASISSGRAALPRRPN
jgi:hypothetical protein